MLRSVTDINVAVCSSSGEIACAMSFVIVVCLSAIVSTFTANTITHSAAERFALLEERDKFLRSSMFCTFIVELDVCRLY